MKKINFIFCLAFISKSIFSQIGYNFTSVGGAFVLNATPTNIINSAIDDGVTALQVNGTAKFTSSIAIGNSVAAAVAAPSTHKVAILIGGVQYYLLASNV